MKTKLILLCAALLAALASCGGNGGGSGEAAGTAGAVGLEARTMHIHRIDGGSAIVTDERGRQAPGDMEGQGLHEGWAVATMQETFCYIRLDASSMAKMDEYSGITVAALTDRLLRIDVTEGQVLVNVHGQRIGHSLETAVGNTVIGVRGTVFIAGVWSGGEAIVIVLEGSVDVNGVALDAGYAMRVHDGLLMLYDIAPIDADELDGFQLSAFLETQGGMAANGNGDGDDDRPGAAAQSGANLTGAPPLSFQDTEPYEHLLGRTLHEIADAGHFGDTSDFEFRFWLDDIASRINEVNDARMFHSVGGGPQDNLPYHMLVDSEMRVMVVNVSTQNDRTASGMLRFRLGMSLREVLHSVAITNPELLSLADNPSYEKFQEIITDASRFNDAFVGESGTWQMVSVRFAQESFMFATLNVHMSIVGEDMLRFVNLIFDEESALAFIELGMPPVSVSQ